MYLVIKVHIALFSFLSVSVRPFFVAFLGSCFVSWEKHGVLESEVSLLFNSLVYLIKLTTMIEVV